MGECACSLRGDVDRFKMLQEQHTLTLRDLDGLTKRNCGLYERFTVVDI